MKHSLSVDRGRHLDHCVKMLPSNRRILESVIIIFASVAIPNEFKALRATALTIEDKPFVGSLCPTHHRVQMTRNKSYRETYIKNGFFSSKVKTRTHWVTEYYWVWEQTNTCCEGYEPYEHDMQFDACKPVCRSGCQNGSCLAPNACHCNANHTASLNATTGYSECLPHCPSGCQGGLCQAPNVCACDPGYVSSDDGTRCEASCDGINSDNYPPGCGTNATCVAPNTCQCHDGYVTLRNSTIIDPSSLAPASDSLSPDNRVFTAGGVVCKPLCGLGCPKNAACLAPDTCECDAGYASESSTDPRSNESQCLPVCSKSCVNGLCSHPNVCTCLQGYKPHLEDSFACEPICDDECINAVCARPNVCECKVGYEKVLTLKRAENVCGPICPGGCPNGNCIAPGLCSCHKGYTLRSRTTDGETTTNSGFNDTDGAGNPFGVSSGQICQPVCRVECPNGSSCVAPDECQLQLRTIYTDDACANNGITSKDNGTCFCNYGWSGSRCDQATFCGILVADDSSINDDFATFNRVYHPDMWDWRGPRCEESCGDSLLRLASSTNGSDEAGYHCYHLVLHEKTIGLVSDVISPSDLLHRENKTIFCLMTADSPCNAIKSSPTRLLIVSLAIFLTVACALAGLYACLRVIKTDDTLEPLKMNGILSINSAEIDYL